MGLEENDDKRKWALLLHYAGEHVYDIDNAEKGTSGDTYKETKEVLSNYFAPKKNIQVEIFTFRSCTQKDEQTLDAYVTELRQLAKHCNFENGNKENLGHTTQKI